MVSGVHRLTDVDKVALTATCAACGPESPILVRKYNDQALCKQGQSTIQGRYRKATDRSEQQAAWYQVHKEESKAHNERTQRPYRRFVRNACERCGRTAEEVGTTLHVHHKDGHPSNNAESNLETLCPSCHTTHHNLEGN